MNDYHIQYKSLLQNQWQTMDWTTKSLAIFTAFIILIGGFFTGLMIFGASLVITGAFCLKSLVTKIRRGVA